MNKKIKDGDVLTLSIGKKESITIEVNKKVIVISTQISNALLIAPKSRNSIEVISTRKLTSKDEKDVTNA